MEKMRVAGVVGLVVSVIVSGGWGNNSCLAQSVEINELQRSQTSLMAAVEDAKSAREYAVAYPSAKYPGFVKYIDKLLSYAEADAIEDEAELTRALNEVAVAVKLVLGNETAKHEAIGHEAVTVRSTEKNQTTAEDARTVVPPEEINAMEDTLPDGEVAVPNTGEETKRAGLGELILAGLIVAVGTVGATILIIKDKKNR